jgi:hypothetical protein
MHLFIILNDACKDGKHALASISSVKQGQFFDETCVIEANEHTFIKRKSFVKYNMARVLTTTHIVKCVEGWTFMPKDSISQEITDRMFAGALASDFTPIYVQKYLRTISEP